MEQIENIIDKSSWGPGPWQQEPDRKEWKDAGTGMTCLAVRHERLGHWCGYVAVEPGYPAYAKDYDDIDVSVHGGLTYASYCHGRVCHVPEHGKPDNVYWFGFDCAHCYDISPGLDAVLYMPEFRDRLVYRTLEYVEQQCTELAQQLKAMEPLP